MKYVDLKAIIARKNLAWQHDEQADSYNLFAVDGVIRYDATVWKDGAQVAGIDQAQEAADLADFEANHKSASNFASGVRAYAFSTPDFLFSGNGVIATAEKNSTTNIDFLIPGALGSSVYINGAVAFTKDAVFGDYASADIVDVNNILGYGAGLVLAQYVPKWYINPSSELDISTPYAGKVPAGIFIRVAYTSVGLINDVGVAVNYRLHLPL